MSELGYIDGKNIFIDWRERTTYESEQAFLAQELVRLKVDVIVTAGDGATRPAKEATSIIPIVMATVLMIPLATALPAALQDPVKISLGCPSFRRS